MRIDAIQSVCINSKQTIKMRRFGSTFLKGLDSNRVVLITTRSKALAVNKSCYFTVPEIYYQSNGFDHDHYYHALHSKSVVCLRQYHVIPISVFM